MDTSDLYKEVVDSISAHVAIIDEHGVILETNQAWEDFAAENDMEQSYHSVGINYFDICGQAAESDDEASEVAKGIRLVLTGKLSEFMTHYPCHSPEKKQWFVVRVVPFRKKRTARAIITHENITPVMEMQEVLRKKEHELMQERQKLEETNIALRVLLRQRDEDRSRLEETVYNNVDRLVLPYITKLLEGRLSDKHRTLAEIADNNLRDIISPFLRTFSSLGLLLTPQEIEVAHLVRNGKSSKEIAEIMGLSVAGIDFHRKRLRQKLGLANTKKNLRSHLLTLDKK
ncbi:MAG: helix-turn-helix transcriptional regulator [Desulfofustis sp.]|jgi:DNA-binding CsgD family transcriptional regulator|nr:helix-turn-helix transcriptional regulator [Desulfofustis sp.]